MKKTASLIALASIACSAHAVVQTFEFTYPEYETAFSTLPDPHIITADKGLTLSIESFFEGVRTDVFHRDPQGSGPDLVETGGGNEIGVFVRRGALHPAGAITISFPQQVQILAMTFLQHTPKGTLVAFFNGANQPFEYFELSPGATQAEYFTVDYSARPIPELLNTIGIQAGGFGNFGLVSVQVEDFTEPVPDSTNGILLISSLALFALSHSKRRRMSL